MSMADQAGNPSTARLTRGRVPVFRIQRNGEDFPITVQEAVVSHALGAHEAVALRVTSSELTTTDGVEGSAIAFFYGQSPRTELFCGYIHTVGEAKTGNGNLSFSMAVIGTTQPMQYGQPRFWRRRNVPDAVRRLVHANGLGFDSHPHTFVWDKLAQTGQSDWSMIREFATKLGWGIFTRYGVVMCYDPLKLHKEQGVYATLSPGLDREFDPSAHRRLIDFEASEVASIDPRQTGGKIAFFTPQGALQVSKERGDFKRYKFVTEHVMNSVEEAEVFAATSESQLVEWKQSATIRMWGDADIYPGMTVDVVTSNNRYLRQKYDGRWLVIEVTHSLDTQEFQTQLQLARPSNTVLVSQLPYQSFWTAQSKARPTLLLGEDNTWSSSWNDPLARSLI